MSIAAPSLSLSEQIQAEKAKRSFALFVKEAWYELEPGTPLLWNWHMDALCLHLQATYNREITRLLIGIAPGHTKSSLVSVLFPVWCWINEPRDRWLCASHSLDLAIRDNRNRRRLIESDWFQARYSNVFRLAGDQNVKSFFENDKKGYQIAVAVRSSGTGKRATHLLIDDPHNAMEGEANRKATIEWFGKTWVSRLNDQKTGPMVVVGQRLHEEDLSGHILQLGGWQHLCLPEEFEPTRKCFTSIGWSDLRTIEGQLLWPEKFSRETLEKLKFDLGPLDYAAQYQQLPVPAGGYIFKQEDERFFTETEDSYLLETPSGIKPVLKSDCWLFSTMDLAISSKQTADYSVIATFACTPARDLLLLDIRRGRWSHTEQQKQVKLVYLQFEPDYFSIESVAYQLALIQDLLIEGIPCREYRPTKDKVSRASSASVWMANGKMYWLKNATWLPDFRAEVFSFPRAAHDDQVDDLSMAADIIRAHGPLSSDYGYDDSVIQHQELLEEEKAQAEEAAKQPPLARWLEQQKNPFLYAEIANVWGGNDGY